MRLTHRPADDAVSLHQALARSRADIGEFQEWAKTGFLELGDAATYIASSHRLRAHDREHAFGLFLRDTGALVGGLSLHPLVHARRGYELGYWLSSEHSRRGYMSEALTAVTRVTRSSIP